MKPLSESTTVTIGLLIVIVGGVVWLSSIYHTANEARAAAEDARAKQERMDAILVEMRTDVKWLKRRMGGE